MTIKSKIGNNITINNNGLIAIIPHDTNTVTTITVNKIVSNINVIIL